MDFVTDKEFDSLNQFNLGDIELFMIDFDMFQYGKLLRSTYDDLVHQSLERNAIGFEPVN